MNLFDVYSLFDVIPVKGEGCYVWDDKGNRYLDLYGGHAVISVGHSHPYYIEKIKKQLDAIGFYSNSVIIPQQKELADKLGKTSGYPDYQLFLCNSGAEANENAIKLASFVTGRKKIVGFTNCFHGRTSAAVAVTDNPKIVAPVNQTDNAVILPYENLNELQKVLETKQVAAVIIEGIQGIGGIHVPSSIFLNQVSVLCKTHGSLLILDEIQSGYGRSGKFFAHQYSNIRPDIITLAKGMGNGFPVGGVMITPSIKPWKGMLGTTFGGNYLACAAGIAVLDIMNKENLIENAAKTGQFLMSELNNFELVKEARGKGLMIGIEFDFPIKDIRNRLLFEHRIFTGAAGINTIRLLPSLTLSIDQAKYFIEKFKQVLVSSPVYSD
jgi:acetylornithine aminotransferase